MKKIDLTGNIFGRLTVLTESKKRNISNEIKWDCICICGNTCSVSGRDLRCGDTKSCIYSKNKF